MLCGYFVVAGGVVGPWFIEALRAPAAAAGIPLPYAVLRPITALRSSVR